jgi:hypothetical protein
MEIDQLDDFAISDEEVQQLEEQQMPQHSASFTFGNEVERG